MVGFGSRFLLRLLSLAQCNRWCSTVSYGCIQCRVMGRYSGSILWRYKVECQWNDLARVDWLRRRRSVQSSAGRCCTGHVCSFCWWGLLSLCLSTFFGTLSIWMATICNYLHIYWKLFLKLIPRFLHFWLTSGLGKMHFWGLEVSNRIYLETFTEK